MNNKKSLKITDIPKGINIVIKMKFNPHKKNPKKEEKEELKKII